MREAVSAKTVWRERKLAAAAAPKFRKFTASDLFLVAAGLIILFVAACAIVPQWIAPYAPTEMRTDSIMQAPSGAHLFGTDYFGRDIFSVVVYGSRDSLFIGFASVLVGGLLGGTIGALSGYAGGWIDTAIMRLNDVLMTIPGILLALAIAGALGPSLFNIVLAVAVSSVPGYARVMRAQVLSIKSRTFVKASVSIGASPLRVFWKHVLPNSLSPLLVMAAIGIGTSILTGSGLSFLGLGVLREVPDWGTLLSQGRGYLTAAWWICTFPGLAITAFVLSVNIIGDRLRDHFDPKKVTQR
ncbi:ABC transporter permease [Paenibacillus cellulositrophicus]|uniref:Peptide/nickel transport system permease protein n=1 Tax=Paenibacillus favisporus TaxID=221028 RepID=A0ABV2FBS6_9BACL|nr:MULTISPECIES: ABC transporter permease [Paenibacillus]MCM2995986.1 ABC transporter permease [Paenibacillus cellulositrophicus]MEC0175307.1 ABC transporter permease [Paenibacillus favisporus]RED36406.1 peptide/nickel transport system permease protein [Paenibacillus sp. VMFN-D1]